MNVKKKEHDRVIIWEGTRFCIVESRVQYPVEFAEIVDQRLSQGWRIINITDGQGALGSLLRAYMEFKKEF